MKINVRQTVKDLAGLDIPLNDDPNKPMRVADVLTAALLSAPHPPGSERPADQSVKRYGLAMEIYKAQTDINIESEIEISADMAVLLKADINRNYGPIVSGQILPLLDGK